MSSFENSPHNHPPTSSCCQSGLKSQFPNSFYLTGSWEIVSDVRAGEDEAPQATGFRGYDVILGHTVKAPLEYLVSPGISI